MSLEVKVYKEISSYQPKVMWGMSWRQIATTAIAIPTLAGTYATFYWAGNPGLGEWAIVILTIPFALIGWVRPLGLPFEQWAKYVWAAYQTNQKLTYYHYTPTTNTERHETDAHPNYYQPKKQRRKQKTTETGR